MKWFDIFTTYLVKVIALFAPPHHRRRLQNAMAHADQASHALVTIIMKRRRRE